MAKIDKLDDRKKGDRLTAQLGLGAAEQVEATGACLTPDQLADVATNHCSPEERKAALAHFSSCRRCYDAWVGVSLSLVAMESGLERRKRPLLSLRNMGYLGSAVAIAASVVVFFNIKGDLIQTTMPVPAEKALEQVQPSEAERPEQQLLMKEEDNAPSATTPSAETRNKAKRAEMPLAEPAAKSVVGKSVPAPMAPPAALDQDTIRLEAGIVITSSGWLSGLERYCREKRYHENPAQWNLLREEGLQLRESETDTVLMEKLSAILATMNVTTELDEVIVQCGVILPLLAGEDKKE
ncbi:hypothetical protein [Desulfopila aestuarii]|uniref:Zinc-finger n=1 Tax=Desulfopila aestuarii DSM 18488 TaxID=1121416 RepID=A0A1M7XVW1_9BACT|nr:hypothetical protein [Desulfopila aestuarii]SHO42849.1 hypothetical protein SAMN02745220_00187 [Desulfopila aestuarii DSM 18488]